jgi:mono/diheme cytochrome c family protein
VIREAALAALLLGAAPLLAQNPTTLPQQGAMLPRNSAEAAVFRGGLVYANYCVTCHGVMADGNGRAARLYDPRPANLRASNKNDAYVELIVRRGGELLGRSGKMPPWEEELTDEQISDIVQYIRSLIQTR